MIKSDVPCNLTEYITKFKTHDNYQPRGMIKPPQKIVARDTKMESDTTNRRDFIAHPVTPPAKTPSVPYQPPDKEMHTATEYKQAFLGKWQTPTQPILPPRHQEEHMEHFNHSTTHAADYSAPPVTPRQLFKAPSSYEPPKSPFDDRSTTRSDFVDYGKVPMTPSLKPPSKVTGSTQPLNEITSYRSTFTAPTMPDRFERPNQIYIPSSEGLSNSTTFRSAFPKHPVSKPPKAIKPPCHKHGDSRIPFETSTTNHLTYKSWEIPKRFSRPPTTFMPPTEKVSDQTTFKSHYLDYGHVPLAASFKPLQKKEQVPPFESLTTQSVDYKAWGDIKRPESFAQDKQYEPPKEKFDSTTTFKAHYKGAYEPRAASTKPPQKVPAKVSEIDSMTVYKETFSGPGYKPCPSIPLLANDAKASKFVYSHEGPNGHELYKPIDSSETVKG